MKSIEMINEELNTSGYLYCECGLNIVGDNMFDLLPVGEDDIYTCHCGNEYEVIRETELELFVKKL